FQNMAFSHSDAQFVEFFRKQCNGNFLFPDAVGSLSSRHSLLVARQVTNLNTKLVKRNVFPVNASYFSGGHPDAATGKNITDDESQQTESDNENQHQEALPDF